MGRGRSALASRLENAEFGARGLHRRQVFALTLFMRTPLLGSYRGSDASSLLITGAGVSRPPCHGASIFSLKFSLRIVVLCFCVVYPSNHRDGDLCVYFTLDCLIKISQILTKCS